MTSIEKHVISLGLSKRLKYLGVKQDSLFAWRGTSYDKKYHISLVDSYDDGMYEAEGWNIIGAAFLSSEIGEILPAFVWNHDYTLLSSIEFSKSDRDGKTVYVASCDSVDDLIIGDTMAEAMGEMLAYLLENKLISPEPIASDSVKES